MGYSNWAANAYDSLSSQRATRSTTQIFTATSSVHADLNPHGVEVRESRDSDAHPNSNAIIIAFDVTGSMHEIPEQFARQELGKLMRLLVSGGYIPDPQVLFAAIGDAYTDKAPWQIGQFESGLEMDDWLTKIYLEGYGGGQVHESYGLAHYWAAHHTAIDCYEKRGRRGYLITMGDEKPHKVITRSQIKQLIGDNVEADVTIAEAIRQASVMYNVFHIVTADPRTSHGCDPSVHRAWRDQLGERALILKDMTKVCELIATTIGCCEGNLDLDSHHVDHNVRQALVPLVSSSALVHTASLEGRLPVFVGSGRTERL